VQPGATRRVHPGIVRGGCVDSGIVAAWISGRLSVLAIHRLEAHADGCAACLAVLAAIGRVCADPHSMEVQRTHGAPALAPWVLLSAAGAPAVGRYRLGGVLGSGGFGVVYEAEDVELHRGVAIKALFAAADPEHADALRTEARALASLSHPNVVQVYDVVETSGRLFLVMELVRGRTLRDWQRAATRSRAEILERYLAAAQGLVAIHDAGLVHADIKPDNVLVAEDGRVLVSDFGLARAAVAGQAGIAGTPRYMAPEQKAGRSIDARADQYGFCVALWEALFGGAPDEAPTREPPARLRAALRRGLAPDPAERWPSVRALVAALRDAERSRAGRWLVAASMGALVTTLGIGAAFADAPTPIPAPVAEATPPAAPPAAPEVAAEIEHAVQIRDGGDLVAAHALLLPLVHAGADVSVPLRVRARQELARTLAVMGFADQAKEHWTAAHESAVAHDADLLAAGIAIDLARHDAGYAESIERARVWLRTAEAELRRVEIDPAEHAELALVAAMITKTDGRIREAEEAFEAASKLPGADEITRVRLRIEWGGTLGRLGEHELGLAKIAEGHALCDAHDLGRTVERIELRRAAATLQQNLGRFDEAVKEMDLALDLAGEIHGLSRGHRSSLHGDLGVFHLQLNHRDDSERHLKEALELAPDSWTAHANLSIHYGKLACRRDVDVPGCDPDAADLGYAHELRALELAREAFGEDHPTFATMRANVARELLNRGELERAQDDLELSCAQLALHFGAEAHQLVNPLYGLVEANVRLGRREPAAAAAERLHAVAHGAAFASRKDAIAVLDYVVGRTLAWHEPPSERAAELMKSGRGFFGERPPDDFMLVDAWFQAPADG
jgi:tetratricopeptide (TPR) repeat protein/predicted Ser/Thr protein kinase